MTQFIQPPGSGGPQQPQVPPTPPAVNINPKDLEDIVCDKCGNYTFQPIILMKMIPGIISPTGNPAITRTDALSCVVCNTIPVEIRSSLAAIWFKSEDSEKKEGLVEENIQGSQLPGLELVKPGDENVDTSPTDG